MTEQDIRDEAERIHGIGPLGEYTGFIEGAKWALSQQGEGKGMDSELEKANKIIAHLRQVRVDEGQHIVRYLKVEHDHQQQKFDELGISKDCFFEQRVNALIFLYERLLDQSPSNPPEVKENELYDLIDSVPDQLLIKDEKNDDFLYTYGAMRWLVDRIKSFQPKPEKTAEEILRSYIAYTPNSIEEQSIIEAMKEYASQSSSSLRDALEKLDLIINRYESTGDKNDDEYHLMLERLNGLKALLTANKE